MPDAFDQLIRDVSRLSASAVVGAVDDEENASKTTIDQALPAIRDPDDCHAKWW